MSTLINFILLPDLGLLHSLLALMACQPVLIYVSFLVLERAPALVLAPVQALVELTVLLAPAVIL